MVSFEKCVLPASVYKHGHWNSGVVVWDDIDHVFPWSLKSQQDEEGKNRKHTKIESFFPLIHWLNFPHVCVLWFQHLLKLFSFIFFREIVEIDTPNHRNMGVSLKERNRILISLCSGVERNHIEVDWKIDMKKRFGN